MRTKTKDAVLKTLVAGSTWVRILWLSRLIKRPIPRGEAFDAGAMSMALLRAKERHIPVLIAYKIKTSMSESVL